LAEGGGGSGDPAEPPSAEQQFATSYRDALNASRKRWLGEGPRDGED
jgi:hypothetical protein